MANNDNQINMPGAFGGLMRYNEEYTSLINLKPSFVIVLILALVVARIFLLPLLFPLI